MRIRTSRSARLGLALATITALTLTGCEVSESGGDTVVASGPGTPGPSAESPGSPASAGASSAGLGRLPDVCALLSKSEVTALAGGSQVLQIDPDDAGPDATVRYCQWQMSGARLAVQLSTTTEADFGSDHPGAEQVSDLGDDAHFFANHLFVRKGPIQIDIYASTSAGGEADKLLARAAAAQLLPRL